MTTPANPAVLADVVIERPLTTTETTAIPKWLDQAWTILRGDVPGIPARMALAPTAAGYLDPALVKQVLGAMVERKVRNPDGLRSWTVDDVESTVDAALSTGQLYSTPDERERLAVPVPASGGYSLQLGR